MTFSKYADDSQLFFCNFSILSGDSADNFNGEIESLQTDSGYFQGTGKVDGQSSTTFEKDQETTVNGVPALNYSLTHYVVNGTNSYRISYGGMLPDNEAMNICKLTGEKMLSSISFN